MKHKDKPRGPLLGAHMSIAGGVDKSLFLGKTVDCDAIQIFTKSSRQWAAKPYTKEEIELFDLNRKATGITTVIAHDSYLLNLGSPDAALRKRSVAAFIDEMERCEVLGRVEFGRSPRRPRRRRRETKGSRPSPNRWTKSTKPARVTTSKSHWRSLPARVRTSATASSRSAT